MSEVATFILDALKISERINLIGMNKNLLSAIFYADINKIGYKLKYAIRKKFAHLIATLQSRIKEI